MWMASLILVLWMATELREGVQVAVDRYKVSIEANSFVHNSTQLLATGKHQSQTH